MVPVTSDTVAVPLKVDGAESESESESDAIPDAAEVFSVVDAVQKHGGEYVSGTRNHTELRYFTYDNFSQVSLPMLELSENSQRILASTTNMEELQASTREAQPGHSIIDLEQVRDHQLNTWNIKLEELDIKSKHAIGQNSRRSSSTADEKRRRHTACHKSKENELNSSEIDAVENW